MNPLHQYIQPYIAQAYGRGSYGVAKYQQITIGPIQVSVSPSSIDVSVISQPDETASRIIQLSTSPGDPSLWMMIISIIALLLAIGLLIYAAKRRKRRSTATGNQHS